ncbi:hypothetical protein ILUMI_03721 [Ignelater luminosus]|uniref:Uncharacterized protein n=1 Tax=Ignelater luminosus TaxID=2038154 RepID=A0A8K0DAG2_IGNLU|nr:hypothetical protein ILUMI_03721 [Ignelater luminosus]
MPSPTGDNKEKEIACYLFPFLEDKNNGKNRTREKKKAGGCCSFFSANNKQQQRSPSATKIGSQKRSSSNISASLTGSHTPDRFSREYDDTLYYEDMYGDSSQFDEERRTDSGNIDDSRISVVSESDRSASYKYALCRCSPERRQGKLAFNDSSRSSQPSCSTSLGESLTSYDANLLIPDCEDRPDIYRRFLGPTPDETILVILQWFSDYIIHSYLIKLIRRGVRRCYRRWGRQKTT